MHSGMFNCLDTREFINRITTSFTRKSILAEAPYPIRDLFRSLNYEKGGYILFVTYGKEVRKHFVEFDKITRGLIFCDIISIV